jgi:predicted O-methyltransferase YrrM
MIPNASFLPETLWSYVQKNAVSESEHLAALRTDTEKIPEGEWQIPPEQGQFLAFLVALVNAKNILEIGTFTGYGTLCMAQALGEGGKIVTLECTSKYSDIGQKHWEMSGVSARIDLKLGMALETLPVLAEAGCLNSFDFVFIDADKKEYDHYYEHALQFVKVGGVIAVDNMLWRGAVVDSRDQKKSTKSIRNLMIKIKNDDRVSSSFVPIGDGLMLVRRVT